jgi:hypothetical protein
MKLHNNSITLKNKNKNNNNNNNRHHNNHQHHHYYFARIMNSNACNRNETAAKCVLAEIINHNLALALNAHH